MAVDLKQTSRRLMEEAFGRGKFEVFDEVCAEEYRAHDPLTGDTDREGEKQVCRMYKEAFPDLKPTILSSYTDGEVCVLHWRMTGTHQKELMGLEAMGARCTVEGITIDRFKAGKIVESWIQWDALGLLRQLGVAPTVSAAPVRVSSEPRHHA
jgi:predicted ester cyclase